MKTLKNILIASVALLAVGCYDISEVNENPTRSSDTDPQLLIPTIQAAQTYSFQSCTRYLIYPGGFVNHWTGPWGVVEYGGKGKKNHAYMERLWQTVYPQSVKNLIALEQSTAEQSGMENLQAVSKVLRVETFLPLTDYYGDVPYFQSGLGHFEKNFVPVYDRQQEIYMDFFLLLDQALELFGTNPDAVLPKYDFYFDGNIEKWKRFTNSLKLRLAMRLIKVNPEMAKAKALEAIQGGVMTSNEDIAEVKYDFDRQDEGAGNGYANAMAQKVDNYGPTQYRLTTDLFNALIVAGPDNVVGNVTYRTIAAEDPRLRFIAGSYTDAAWGSAYDVTDLCKTYNAATGSQQGPQNLSAAVDGYINRGGYLTVPSQEFNYGGGIEVEYGVNLSRNVWAGAITKALVPALPVASVTHYLQRLQPSKWVNAADAPWVHMSYAETQFLLAETTLRGWDIDNVTAAERFTNGYRAAVKQWSSFGVTMATDATIDAYLARLMPAITAGGSTAMEEVCKQQWILHMFNPIEAWSLIRRTDGMPSAYVKFYNRYPNENETGGKMPRRMQYPLEEQTKNQINYQAAVDRMGGSDDWMKRVWWDVE